MNNQLNIIKAAKIFLPILLASLLLSSCSSNNHNYGIFSHISKRSVYRKLSREDRGHTKYRGHYKVGKPYKIKGKTYRPREYRKYVKTGVASWYGSEHGFHGHKTANGDIYNKHTLSAAHPTLPLPSLVKVKNLSNGKSLIVMVNDRGPFSSKRIIDVSEKSAQLLGFKKQGTAKVRVQYLRAETDKFLKILDLKRKNGHRPKRPIRDKKCTVNCQIKRINLKYKFMRR